MNVINAFNTADLVTIGIIALSALISLFRGFVREALSLVSWALAFWVTLSFGHAVASLLDNYINSPTLRLGCAFGGLFVLTLICCGILNYIISRFIDKTGLTGTDRLIGIIFGLARGILLVAALLLAAHLTPMPEEDWWKTSLTIPYFEPIESWLQNLLPTTVVEHFKLSKQ